MRKTWVFIAVVLGGLGFSGCNNDPAFACASDIDCEDRDGGRCGPAGYCAFPDATCPSTLRYVEHSGSLSGKCVPLSPDSDTLADTESEGVTGDPPETTSTSGTNATGSSTSPATSAGPTSTTDDPTFPPDCAQPGQTCGGDDDCCGGCLRCENGACVPRTGETEPCGECQACDATGVCAIDEGGPCDGPTIDCTQYVAGLEGENCLAAAGVAGATCDALGVCTPADPSGCTEPGDVILNCDEACLDNPAACQPGALASSVTVAAMCLTEQDAAGCIDSCSLMGAVRYVHTERWCGEFGQCSAKGPATSCLNYYCDESGCDEECRTTDDCFSGDCVAVGGGMHCCGGVADALICGA